MRLKIDVIHIPGAREDGTDTLSDCFIVRLSQRCNVCFDIVPYFDEKESLLAKFSILTGRSLNILIIATKSLGLSATVP